MTKYFQRRLGKSLEWFRSNVTDFSYKGSTSRCKNTSIVYGRSQNLFVTFSSIFFSFYNFHVLFFSFSIFMFFVSRTQQTVLYQETIISFSMNEINCVGQYGLHFRLLPFHHKRLRLSHKDTRSH
jgi:hypothetical protein